MDKIFNVDGYEFAMVHKVFGQDIFTATVTDTEAVVNWIGCKKFNMDDHVDYVSKYEMRDHIKRTINREVSTGFIKQKNPNKLPPFDGIIINRAGKANRL